MTLPDLPIVNAKLDLLDRRRLAEALGRTLGAADLGTPLAAAIYGDWGTGKTSVMRMVEAALPANSIRLWFDAWRYARQAETLWRALLLAVVDALRDALCRDAQGETHQSREEREQELDHLVERLDRSRTDIERGPLRVDLKSAATFGFDLALRYASLGTVSVHDILGALKGEDAEKAGKLIRRAETEHFRAQVTSLDQFYRELGALLRKHGIGKDAGRRLYVFVDDLDRCLPEEAVSALEAIKLFLDFEGCVFVLGMDRRVIEQGIAVRYQEYHAALGEPIDPRQYLDKIIQLPVTLPPLGERQIETYLAGLGGVAADVLIKQCHALVRAGTPTNPRSVKRVINSLMLMLELAGTRSLSELQAKEEAQRLAKLSVLQVCQPDLFRRIADQPRYLKTLESAARNPGTPSEAKTVLEEVGHRPVMSLLQVAPFFDNLGDSDLARLVALSARTA
jgi:hypothetical protein